MAGHQRRDDPGAGVQRRGRHRSHPVADQVLQGSPVHPRRGSPPPRRLPPSASPGSAREPWSCGAASASGPAWSHRGSSCSRPARNSKDPARWASTRAPSSCRTISRNYGHGAAPVRRREIAPHVRIRRRGLGLSQPSPGRRGRGIPACRRPGTTPPADKAGKRWSCTTRLRRATARWLDEAGHGRVVLQDVTASSSSTHGTNGPKGAHLEPDAFWGRAYLEVTREVLRDRFGVRAELPTSAGPDPSRSRSPPRTSTTTCTSSSWSCSTHRVGSSRTPIDASES